MEGHRGVYTSQGWIKRANRLAERALHEAEALCAMAGLDCDLDDAWRLLCLNQFHDILTGTSVPEVFVDARADFARIAELVEPVAARAAQSLRCAGPAVANTAPVGGPRVIELPGEDGAQRVAGGSLAYIPHLPAYGVTPLSAAATPDAPVRLTETGDGAVMENGFVRIEIDRTGRLVSAFDKGTDTEILSAPGNHLMAFEDRPVCWDAWDIDPSIEDRVEAVEGETRTEIVETGPLRAAVRVETRWRESTISQTLRLTCAGPRLDVVTEVDWHERHTLLKAAFPTTVRTPTADFDVQWGHVTRSTSRQSAFDAARFEVPMQKWVRLSDRVQSVVVLNDCKYGCDVQGGTIRLTLIKSSTAPDPEADQGHHAFTYSLLCTASGDRGRLDHEAYALNTPVRRLEPGGSSAPETFLHSGHPAIIVETVVPDAKGVVILRLFEAHGATVESHLDMADTVLSAELVDFHGRELGPLAFEGRRIAVSLGAFEIRSLRVVLERS